jgi:protein O-mannosyl-transferase
VAVVVILALRKRWPVAAAGGATFVLAIGPMLGLATFDFQRTSTVADHYLYLAMAGGAVVAAVAIDRIPKRFAVLAGVIVVALLSVVAHLQTYAWADSETLFKQTIYANPTSVVANVNLGNRRLEEARAGWREGRLGDATTRAEEAMVHYRQALRAHPDDDLARRGAAKAMGLIGAASAREGRIEEAIPQLRKALEYDPDDRDNRLNLEKVLQSRGGGGTRR